MGLSLIATSDHPLGGKGRPVAPGEAGHILWVDDDPRMNLEEAGHLEGLGFLITRTSGTAQTLSLYDPDVFDLVITDVGRLEEGGYNERAGLDRLGRLRERDPHAAVILFTSARATSPTAIWRAPPARPGSRRGAPSSTSWCGVGAGIRGRCGRDRPARTQRTSPELLRGRHLTEPGAPGGKPGAAR